MTKRSQTEADLCSDFIAWVRAKTEWIPYAETAGWDILLVHSDGSQLGIQAKLTCNVCLLRQVLAECGDGPDYRGILVPEAMTTARDVRAVCEAIGLVWCRRARNGRDFCMTHLLQRSERSHEDWPHWGPLNTITLPDYVPDVRAGASAPTQLTAWKIKALKIIARMEVLGFVTAIDFKEVGLDKRNWLSRPQWLRKIDKGRWGRGDNLRFDVQHPTVYAQILEETRDQFRSRDQSPV